MINRVYLNGKVLGINQEIKKKKIHIHTYIAVVEMLKYSLKEKLVEKNRKLYFILLVLIKLINQALSRKRGIGSKILKYSFWKTGK